MSAPKIRKTNSGARASNTSRTSDIQQSVNDDSLALGLEEELEEEEGGIRIGDIYVPPPPPPALTYDCTGPRLIITQIVNVNFKSYAGKEVLGPFDKSFTAIVGPNGSGKSNVIDSMLFVFGYRAQKIRSKKIGVLIHSSSKFPNVNSCTVTVQFCKILDKDKGFDVIPNSEFEVSRTAFKDNSSHYQINNRKVPFKEVGKLLRFHGIDLDHNRFLILQGEVEQIAMMKPKAQTEHDSGMLEYLEDIIGSHRFKNPIETLMVQVDELSEQRTEMLNKVKVVEKEKNNLEGPKNEAMQYLKTENRITVMRNQMYQFYLHDKKSQVEQALEKKDEAQKEFDIVEDQLKKGKDMLQTKDNEYKQKGKQAVKCVNFAEKKKAEFDELERKDLTCRESLKHAKTKIKSSRKQLEAEETKLVELRDLPDQVKANNEKLVQEKQELEEKLIVEEEKLAVIVSTLKEETKTLQEEKELHQNKLIGLKAKVDETKSTLHILQSELNVYLGGEQKEKDKLESLSTNVEKLLKDIEEKEGNMISIGQRLPQTRQTMQQIRTELDEVIQREGGLSEKLRSDRMKLEEIRSAQQSTKSRSRQLEELMRLKENKTIPGIFGRLGDLGAIDAKYDVAISTACGPLDHIVTDTLDSAQACVQFLKDNNLGVASFIALDKMGKWIPYTTKQIQTPENVPRLFDLIRVNDQRVLPAFYFAIRDTLVGENLDQATRIGLQGAQRHRVVTYKGELIQPNGTMSGGGGRPNKGRMGQTIVVGGASLEMDSSMDMSRLQKDIDVNGREVEELRNRRLHLEESGRNLERDFRIMEQNREKGGRDLDVLKVQREGLEKQISEQTERVKAAAPDENRIQDLQKPIKAATKEFDLASAAAGEVEAEVKRVEGLIREITTKKMGAVKKTVTSLKNQVEGAQNEITKGNVSAKAAARNMKKCEEKIVSLKDDIVDFDKTIKSATEELNAMLEDGKRINEEYKEAQAERDAIEDELKTMANEISEIKGKMKTLQEEHVDAKNELEKHVAVVTDLKRAVKSHEDLLAKLSLHKIDGLLGTANANDNDNEESEENPTELRKLTAEELENLDERNLKYQIQVAEGNLKDKHCDMSAIENFRRKEKQYLEKVDELDKLTQERDLKRQHYEKFKKQRLNEFMSGFSLITNKLKEVYQMLTQGGDAELELVDSLDPFSDGIVFSVRPPKKSWKNISNLSGGEKTLSSLALVMALHYYRPTPLYVMDEIDAALDFRNVSIVGHYIKERTKNAQFIVISLRNNMYELADRLVGIYKTYDCTHSVTIDPAKVVAEHAGSEPAAETEPAVQNGSAAETEPAVLNGSAAETEPAVQNDSAAETEPAEQNGPAAETEPVMENEKRTVVEEEQAMEMEDETVTPVVEGNVSNSLNESNLRLDESEEVDMEEDIFQIDK